MELQSKFNLLPSTIPIRIVKPGLITNSRLSNFKIESKTISDPDSIADRDYVHENKSFYLFNFKLFHTQKTLSLFLKRFKNVTVLILFLPSVYRFF